MLTTIRVPIGTVLANVVAGLVLPDGERILLDDGTIVVVTDAYLRTPEGGAFRLQPGDRVRLAAR